MKLSTNYNFRKDSEDMFFTVIIRNKIEENSATFITKISKISLFHENTEVDDEVK